MEQSVEYTAVYRRNRYATDPVYRQTVLERNRKARAERGADWEAIRRLKRATDPEWREKQNAKRRGRCQRNDQLKRLYGITLDEYNKMLAHQGGCCAICMETASSRLHVDHCHSTGKVRGLLCSKCNTGLGAYRDNTELLKAAVDYLEKHHEH